MTYNYKNTEKFSITKILQKYYKNITNSIDILFKI